jgi:uncharacterized membrane protein
LIKETKPQTVEELASLTAEKLQVPQREIIKTIIKLQGEGKIRLAQSPSNLPTVGDYLKTGQASWYWATLAATLVTTLVVFTVSEDLYPLAYLRNVLGIVFVLWLPGYAFTRALFPARLPLKTSDKSLDTIERVALSIGMSLALVPIVGLLLNYTPWGITLAPITLSLTALTITFATAAILREHQKRTNAVAAA